MNLLIFLLVKEGASRLVYKALLPWLPEILSYFQDVLLAGLHISSSDSIAPLLDLVQLFSSASCCLYKFIGLCSWSSEDNGRGLSCTGFTDKAVNVLLDIVEKNQVKNTIIYFYHYNTFTTYI